MTIDKYLKIDTIECYEDYDRQMINKILATNNLDKNIEKTLKLINRNTTIKKGNKVIYRLNITCLNNKLGRFYPSDKTSSIGRIWNEIRSALCSKKYWDLDMVNCHYYICKWYAKKNGIDCDFIEQYINEREKILSIISDDREYSKKVMLKILYGGNINNDLNDIYNDWEQNDFIEYINIDYKTKNKDAKIFINNIQSEINEIHKKIYEDNIDCNEFADILKLCIKKKKKIEKTLVSLVLQSYERALLLCIREFLKFKNRSMDILIHDGGLVKKLDDEIEFPIDLINDCENYVKEETGIDIKLAIKPMIYDNDLDDEDSVENYLNINSGDNDKGAAKIFIDKYKHLFKQYEDDNGEMKLIFFNGMIYIHNEKEIDKIIANLLSNIDIIYYNSKGEKKIYTNSIKCINNCIKYIKNIIGSDIETINNYIDTINLNTKTYIPFKNGVWSFKEKKLLSYQETFERNIIFDTFIDDEYIEPNKNDLDDLYNNILIPTYPIEEEREYIRRREARAIAGNVEDKVWEQHIGVRNCGKGKTTTLTSNAFGNFVKEFESNYLTINKFNAGDPRNFEWIVNFKRTRLAIANEVEQTKTKDNRGNIENTISSLKIKKLASGGDNIQARGSYEKLISFKIPFIFIIKSNDSIKCDTNDVFDNCKFIRYRSKFVDEVKYNEIHKNAKEGDDLRAYKLANPNIDNLINDKRIINAYRYYIFNGYYNESPIEPETIKENKLIELAPENDDENDQDWRDYLANNLNRTKKQDDIVYLVDIIENLHYQYSSYKKEITHKNIKLFIQLHYSITEFPRKRFSKDNDNKRECLIGFLFNKQ